jgi:hypothetical protein
MSAQQRRPAKIPGLPVIVHLPDPADVPCEECRWDAVALAIATAAGRPEEAVAICPRHQKKGT